MIDKPTKRELAWFAFGMGAAATAGPDVDTRELCAAVVSRYTSTLLEAHAVMDEAQEINTFLNNEVAPQADCGGCGLSMTEEETRNHVCPERQ